MVKQNSEFDKFIKDNISDFEITRKKGNWELVQHMLNEQARIRKRNRTIQFIISFSVIVSASLLFFWSPKDEKNELIGKKQISENLSNQNSGLISSDQLIANTKDGQKLSGKNYVAPHKMPYNSNLPDEAMHGNAFIQNLPSPRFALEEKNSKYEKNVDQTADENFPSDNFHKSDLLSEDGLMSPDDDYYASLPIISLGDDSYKIEIANLGKGVNSSFSDFAPVISADGSEMYFTSRRPVSNKEKQKGTQSLEHIYACKFNEKNNKWVRATILGNSINVDGRNNSVIGLSNDGQRMFLYRDDINGQGALYESLLNGTEWSPPTLIDEPVNSKYHESSASLSPDGRRIYFVSDRPGGIGGRDIWYCNLDANGKWSEAINIGVPVNTKEDEEGIFIHPDGKTIFFSSKGQNGLGGYDIYRTVYEYGKWSEPENLGAPLNTVDDDVYFVMEANGSVGYYSSAKPGGNGEKDIYRVNFHWFKKEHNTASNLFLLKGTIRDETNDKPVAASIEIIDNEKNTVISKLNSNSITGKYLVSLPAGRNYGIRISLKNYLFHSENFDIDTSVSYSEINKDIKIKPIAIGNKIVLNNIFYDFDKATLRNESISELERLLSLMEEYPTLKIEISSHTDNKGSSEYNRMLSQERAQSVVDYLTGKGISKERLVATGYGESMPVSANENSDGTDNPAGRQMNRRTEFIILAR